MPVLSPRCRCGCQRGTARVVEAAPGRALASGSAWSVARALAWARVWAEVEVLERATGHPRGCPRNPGNKLGTWPHRRGQWGAGTARCRQSGCRPGRRPQHESQRRPRQPRHAQRSSKDASTEVDAGQARAPWAIGRSRRGRRSGRRRGLRRGLRRGHW